MSCPHYIPVALLHVYAGIPGIGIANTQRETQHNHGGQTPTTHAGTYRYSSTPGTLQYTWYRGTIIAIPMDFAIRVSTTVHSVHVYVLE